MSDALSDTAAVRRGTVYGAAAYGLWGLFPLYFHLLAPSGAWEILTHRILWTLALCALVLLVRRDLGWLRSVFLTPRMLGAVTIAGLLIAGNWVIYVAAVVSHHVTEASLGYFLNPLVTVAIGVVVLRERLRRLQWAAVAVGLVGGVYLTVTSGRPPWIALGLAFTFALYGLMKKRLGASLDALHSLTAETAVLAPIAVGVLAWLELSGATTFRDHAPAHPLLLASSGVVTAVPLLLFAAAARRVPLVTIGLLQFVTPILQLLCGVLLLGEAMTPTRWTGFGIVWVALVLLAVDSFHSARSRSQARARDRSQRAREAASLTR